MSSVRSSHLCKKWRFTLDDYSEEKCYQLYKRLSELCSYFIYSKDVSETGIVCTRGFFICKKGYRRAEIEALVSSQAHYVRVFGAGDEYFKDLLKKDNCIEIGARPSVRETALARTRRARDIIVQDFRRLVGQGLSGIEEFSERHPTAYYYHGDKFLKSWLVLQRPKQRDDVKVLWIYGPPGAGKTRAAHDVMPDAYVKDSRTKWWDGYFMEKQCIIDDLLPSSIDINYLLCWFDRYRCYVEIKNGMSPLCVEKFIVTSNFKPCGVYPKAQPVTLAALERRIIVTHIDEYNRLQIT